MIVIYLDRNKILVFVENTKQTLQLDAPQTAISDLELIGKDFFAQVVDSFIQLNNLKILKEDAILVFSQNSAFEKDFPEGLARDREAQVQKFLDIVPFENILTRTYSLDKKIKVVAINKTLFEAIINAFKKNYISISSIVPFSLLSEVYTELSNSVNLGFIAGKAGSFREYSLMGANDESLANESKRTNLIQPKNMRLYALIGIFLVLLLALVILMITTFF